MVVITSLKVICKCDGNFQYHAYFKYKVHLCSLDLVMSVISFIEGVNITIVYEVVCVPGPV